MSTPLQKSSWTTVSSCRVCAHYPLDPVWDVGTQFVNGFVPSGKAYDGPVCPIVLRSCPRCGLVQNICAAPQELLYTGQYWYRSGITSTMRDALKDVYESALHEIRPDAYGRYSEIVLDIGSNDGTFLRNFSNKWIKIGFEPAKNLVEEGSQGIHLVNKFWNYDDYQNVARDFGIVEQRAKIVTALGMFYDLENPNSFIADIAKALHPEGVFIAQLMCLQDMLQVCDFGNLAHEHLEFYTIQSLDYLMNSHGLEIYKLETNQVNGQSTRLYIQHRGGPQPTDASVPMRRLAEQNILARVFEFKKDCERIRDSVKSFINSCKIARRSVAVYGASTKGNTILQYFGLNNSQIDFAAERSPEKFGLVTVGSNIPIVSEEEARQRRPDYFFVLPYAFVDEFVKREQEWLNSGGTFIVPFPTPRLIRKVGGELVTEELQ